MIHRPVLIFGWGVHLAKAEREAEEFANKSGWPVCLTWGAADLVPGSKLRVGVFGTHGTRPANFAVQNADFILSIGSKLDTKATGAPLSSFAPKAEVVMVDVDENEIKKFEKLGRPVGGIVQDAKEFLKSYQAPESDCSEWIKRIHKWLEKYPVVLPSYRNEKGINPYVFVERLSGLLSPEDVIVCDTGCSLGYMMQAFKFSGQRLIHQFNQTPMGCGLPSAVGAAFATGRRVILITGDGGLAVNITEMATVARHHLPIKVILFNNRGHAMCRQTQRQWLGGQYPSTSYDGGLACPSYWKIAKAYEFWCCNSLEELLSTPGPAFLNLKINPKYGLQPQAKFGAPLHDQEPLLPREELEEIMQ